MSTLWGATAGARPTGDEPEDLPLAELDLAGVQRRVAKKAPFYDVAFSYVVAFDLEAIARKAGLRDRKSVV